MEKIILPYEKLVLYIQNNPKRGMVILHSEIEQIIGIKYRTTKYGYAISKANVELTKKNLRLQSISGKGYRILMNNEYDKDAAKNCIQAKHKLEKAKFILENTDETQLVGKHKYEHNLLANEVDSVLKLSNNLNELSNKITILKKGK